MERSRVPKVSVTGHVTSKGGNETQEERKNLSSKSLVYERREEGIRGRRVCRLTDEDSRNISLPLFVRLVQEKGEGGRTLIDTLGSRERGENERRDSLFGRFL